MQTTSQQMCQLLCGHRSGLVKVPEMSARAPDPHKGGHYIFEPDESLICSDPPCGGQDHSQALGHRYVWPGSSCPMLLTLPAVPVLVVVLYPWPPFFTECDSRKPRV